MGGLKIYNVSDKYISFLRKYVPGVYSNKDGKRKHTRKYLGIVYTINGYNYFNPPGS